MNSNRTDSREIRKFGVVCFIFFGSLAAIALWRDRTWALCVFGLLALLGLGFLVIPSGLAPVHSLWLRVAHAIGTVVTTVFLTLAYYLVITPSAMIKRLLSGTPIAMKPDKEANTYWVTRKEAAQPRERFLKRY
ncbi:MAG: hypothetical protein U5R49_00690 [Deltaproteobacteria bacterium]|nr:hypothetical protein [Deltaproteobacteria bacterium]